MQVNSTEDFNSWENSIEVNICVHASLQVSKEEREEMKTMFNNKSMDSAEVICNRTVNLTVKSQVTVGAYPWPGSTEKVMMQQPATDSTIASTDTVSVAQSAECKSSFIKEVVFGLVLILLLSLLVVTCILLFYTNCRHKKSR